MKHGVECSTVCSRDVDVDQTDRRLEAFEMFMWRRMEKISWLDKVTNEKVLGRVNKDRQILNCIWQRKHRWIGHILRCNGLLHEIVEGRMEGEEKFKCCMIWQMMMTLLHSNGQLRTERDGDTEKGCQKPVVQLKTDAAAAARLVVKSSQSESKSKSSPLKSKSKSLTFESKSKSGIQCPNQCFW